MRILLDTNVIIRAAQPTLPIWPDLKAALAALVTAGFRLCVVPQNIYELWVVVTRPLASNGFGLDASKAAILIEDSLSNFQLLRDERGIFDNWLSIVHDHAVIGKIAHDARLVAAMQRHAIVNLLTMNKPDFARFPISSYSPSEILAGILPKQ